MRTRIRLATLLALFLAVFTATSVSATTSYTINYTVTATGTQMVTTMPDVSFDWEVTADGTENLVETPAEVHQTIFGAYGPTDLDNFSEIFDVEIPIPPDADGNPQYGSSFIVFSEYKDHAYLLSKKFNEDHSAVEFRIRTSRYYTYYGSFRSIRRGSYSATLIVYGGQISTTAATAVIGSGSATINVLQGEHTIGAVTPTPPPVANPGGWISGVTYSVAGTNPDAVLDYRGYDVFASTDLKPLVPLPWIASESGSATVDETDSGLPIATSGLVAPNGDTSWSIADDHSLVTTYMSGPDAYADGLPAPVGPGTVFDYTVIANGTQTQTTYPDQSFEWTVAGSGIEDWTELDIPLASEWVYYYDGSDGDVSGYSETYYHTIYPPPGGIIESWNVSDENKFIYTPDPDDSSYYGTSGSIYGAIAADGSSLSLTIRTGNYRYYAGSYFGTIRRTGWWGGTVSISGDLDHFDPVSATDVQTATVSPVEGNKFIGTFSADPLPANGGIVHDISYVFSHTNAQVLAWMDGGDVYAATAISETSTTPWTARETGQGIVQPIDGVKLITTSPLVAPNGDTLWSVADSSSAVFSSMSGNQVFAQNDDDADNIADMVDPDPLVYSSDFDDGSTTGSIVSRGDQVLEITDAVDPSDGVLVTALAGGGLTQAEVSVSGGSGTVFLDAGDQVILTTSSAGIQVIVGPVEATLIGVDGTVASVTIPVGNELVFDPNTLPVTTPVTNPDTLIITVIGEPGEPAHSYAPGTILVPLPSVVPPVVTVPADMMLEALTPTGVIASFTVTAYDDIDGVLVPVCLPVSGSELDLGVHTVTCTATDSSSLIGSDSFLITVKDTTDPVLLISGPITVEANVTDGATPVLLGPAVAFDTVDLAPSLSNNAPGTFPIGETIVTWLAVDASGNEAEATHVLTVEGTTLPVITPPSDATTGAKTIDGASPVDIVMASSLAVGDAVPGSINHPPPSHTS
ncbi:MAG: HYR domain-containing protein, partial [Chloroflexi bacterium]|nr:HYR domain-containing protein [Chloroflexota bacterium]